MKYIVATLIGKHKTYAIPQFFEYLNNLNQKPDALFVSTTQDVYEKCPPFPGMVHVQGPEDTGDDTIKSTTSAREAIRQNSLKYMEITGIEWLLWLDNDIGVPRDLIEKMDKLILENPNLVMAHGHHPARQDDCELRRGMACTFTHRDILAIHPFTRVYLRGVNYGDDQIWLAIVGRLANFRWRKEYFITGGVIFDVVHFVEDGRIKSLPEHLRGELI